MTDKTNNRKHERIKAPEGAVALAEGGMGEIIDISPGGLAMLFLDDPLVPLPDEITMSLLTSELMIMVKTITGKRIWEKEIYCSTASGMVYKKFGIEFGNLTPIQKRQLDNLLASYTSGAA